MLYISTATLTDTTTTDSFESTQAVTSAPSVQTSSANTTNNTVTEHMPSDGYDAQQTYLFKDDAPVVKAGLLDVRTDPDLLSSMVESSPHEIADFLSRPFKVAAITWDPSDPRVAERPTSYGESAVNWSVSFPDALFSQEEVLEKLSRYAFFRADICMRIMANGTPMQQGKLWCWYSPSEAEVSQARVFASQHLSGITGFPGGELDVSAGNVVELRMPYVSQYPFINMVRNTGTMGNLHLSVINPVTMVPIDVTVYAWFENVRLCTPTVATQSIGRSTRVAALKRELRRLEEPVAQGMVSDIRNCFKCGGGSV